MIEQLTTPELIELDGMVKECENSLFRDQSEKDLRKEIADNAKEKFKISSKDFNLLVKERYEDKASNGISTYEEVVELNELLIETRRKSKGQPTDTNVDGE